MFIKVRTLRWEDHLGLCGSPLLLETGRGRLDHTQRRRQCDHRGRGWSVAQSRNAGSPETGRSKEQLLPKCLWKKQGPADSFASASETDSGPLASITVREHMSAVLNHGICGNLLHQSLEANT